MGWKKCERSGMDQAVDWDADPDHDYPGAAVCIGCSFGVLFKKGSIEPGISVAGREGLFGTVRTHYVHYVWDERQRREEPDRMTYHRPLKVEAND